MRSSDPSPNAYGLRAIFAMPAVVAVLSLVGLFVALLGDGVWKAVGAGLVAISPAVLVWALISRRR